MISEGKSKEAYCATNRCPTAHAQDSEVAKAVALWQTLRNSKTIESEKILKHMGLLDDATIELILELDAEATEIEYLANKLAKQHNDSQRKARNNSRRSRK